MTDTMLVSQFATCRFNEIFQFDGRTTAYAPSAVGYEGRFGLRVAVYEPGTGLLKALYDSTQEDCPVESVDFEFLESGCGGFAVKVNVDPESLAIERNDRIDIHLMQTVRPWFSGRVTETPAVSTDRRKFEYRGGGYADILAGIIVNEEYQTKSVGAIVLDLIETYLPTEDVVYFPDRLTDIGFDVEHVRFDRVTLKKALETLADLANLYVFGVNEHREFFFNKKEGRPLSRYGNKASKWIGYHMDGFELREKAEQVVNALHVKIGKIASSSNFASFTAEDLDSIAFFGEREKVVTAPEIKDEADAEAWADYQLSTMSWPKIAGKARGLRFDRVETGEDILRAEGFMRISTPRRDLVSPFHEPLNGYFRYRDLVSADVHGNNWLKREFTCRQSGPIGRVRIMAKKTGAPGNLVVVLKKGATTLDSKGKTTIAEWFEWVTFDLDAVNVHAGHVYTIEIYALSSDASNCYTVLASTHDAPFSGGYFSSTNGGTDWTEDTGKGILFRAYLRHENEFLLDVKKVKYTAEPGGGIKAEVDLGEVSRPLEDRIVELMAKIRSEELLSQSNVEELG